MNEENWTKNKYAVLSLRRFRVHFMLQRSIENIEKFYEWYNEQSQAKINVSPIEFARVPRHRASYEDVWNKQALQKQSFIATSITHDKRLCLKFLLEAYLLTSMTLSTFLHRWCHSRSNSRSVWSLKNLHAMISRRGTNHSKCRRDNKIRLEIIRWGD